MKKTFLLLPLMFIVCASFAQAQAGNLFTAARTNNVALAQSLIDAKADVNQQDDKGYTPLILATYNGNDDVAQLLLKHGADTEKKDSQGNIIHVVRNRDAL